MPKSEAWKTVRRIWENQVIQANVPQHKQNQAEISLQYFIQQEASGNGVSDDSPQMFADLLRTYEGTLHARMRNFEAFRDLAMAEVAKISK